jgi:hypothetical protein
MKKLVFPAILSLALILGCEKETTTPKIPSNDSDVEEVSLKSCGGFYNALLNQTKSTVEKYFIGMETRDYDLMRELVTRNFSILEQGELFDVEGHINWLETVAPEPVVLDFTLEYVDIVVRGGTAWMVFYDHLNVLVDGNVVGQWEGLESAVLVRKRRGWKLAMMTATEVPSEE